MAKRENGSLLSQIEAGALDPSADLPTLLRLCISLGGMTSSTRLRDWASKELKGYPPEDLLPSYRLTRTLLYVDAFTGGGQVTGQIAPLTLIPEEARPTVQGDIHLGGPIAEIIDIIQSTRRAGGDSVNLSPPLAPELVALMNHNLAQGDRNPWGRPTQVVERVYWKVPLARFTGIVDTVRTTLVELVAEMKAGTPNGSNLPSHDIAEQAFDIAIHGNRNHIVVNQVAPGGTGVAAAGAVSVGNPEIESRSRRWMWWAVGLATIVAAIITVIGIA